MASNARKIAGPDGPVVLKASVCRHHRIPLAFPFAETEQAGPGKSEVRTPMLGELESKPLLKEKAVGLAPEPQKYTLLFQYAGLPHIPSTVKDDVCTIWVSLVQALQ